VWLVGAGTGERGLGERVAARIRAEGLDDVVRIAPATDRVAALLRRLDLLVLPSRFEGFPNVVLEAMAAGTLVVAAPVGDVPALVEEGRTGLLFQPGSEEDLARALEAARGLPAEARRAITGEARRRVEERYGMDAVARLYLLLYEAVARRRPRG
jgi:glycosyltransferase involved in cell wall biosynthesis